MKRYRFLLSSVVPFVLLACSEDSQRPPSEPLASASSSAGASGPGGADPAVAPVKPGSAGIAPALPEVPAPGARPEPLSRAAPSSARAEASGRVDRDSGLAGSGSSAGASAGIPSYGQGDPRGLAGEAALASPATPQADQQAARGAGARLLPRSGGASAPPGRSALEYVVEKGDTLAKIADAHQIALPELQAWNPGVDSRRLKIGQTIRLAPPIRTAGSNDAPVAASGAALPSEYTVAKGDTMAAIAREQAVRVEDLRAWNPNADPRRLKIGQKLRLEPPARRADSRS